ncbi:hypothetical protein OUZ56_033054 [Daphnia magna]|uniref:Uncharacterized protein n=1 Tax=Daphnia magna TaxID=35525 RepID=A0ABR0BA42_9CRUS|nr:hypothetical protein OUZ56_033054 [Daphnia magna]
MKFTADVPVDLYGVENTRLVTRGLVTLQVQVLGDNLLQDFIVVDSISEESILGLDALYEHKFIIDGGKGEFPEGPGLNSGVRVDPFINKSSEEAVFTIALVNETNKPISLPRYEIIGTLGFCRIEKDNINSCAERELTSSTVDFTNNLPPDMSGVDRTSITMFLIDRKSIFASTTGELGKTGLVKHHINTEGQGPIRLRPYRIH